MPPINSSSIAKAKKNCSPVSSNCVIWDGLDLPIIQLCTGDSISDVLYKVALVIQQIQESIDLSGVDISTLLSDCEACPEPEKTIQNVFRLIMEKLVFLQQEIDNFDPTITGTLPTINLLCLSYNDQFGDRIITAELDAAVRLLLSDYCNTKNTVTSHTATLQNHEERITELEEQNNEYQLPTISSDCLYSGVRPLDQAVIAIDTDHCAQKAVLGTPSQFQLAFSMYGTSFNTFFSSYNGWIATPVNEAQYTNNMLIMMNWMFSSIRDIQNTCCGTTCDDIKIGFITTFEGSTVVLKFTKGSGSNIPEGWEDCGSVLTISNEAGITTTVDLEIVQDGETDEIDVSMFNVGDKLTFSVDANICSEGSTCGKCYSKVVTYMTNCCTITNASATPNTIVYQVLTTTV